MWRRRSLDGMIDRHDRLVLDCSTKGDAGVGRRA
jgi:hypothetical protein